MCFLVGSGLIIGYAVIFAGGPVAQSHGDLRVHGVELDDALAPEHVAGGILMLASDDAGWITGQSIMANGGNAFGL